MIVLTNSTVELLAPGATVTYDTVSLQAGAGECHRRNTGSVKMKSCGIYDISFSANIGGTAQGDTAELTIQLGGENLPETRMEVETPVAGDLFNVARTTAVKNCCGDYSRVTVTNTGTVAINVAEPLLVVSKRANWG